MCGGSNLWDLLLHQEKKCYILVVVYYMSKWVEAEALRNNDGRAVVQFLKTLLSRFGIPKH